MLTKKSLIMLSWSTQINYILIGLCGKYCEGHFLIILQVDR
jgi:uncharacterized membrane protein YuzA (DUF378 family)